MSPKARTDLRKGSSEAKFDEQADGEVRLSVAPQNPSQNSEKLKFRSENFQKFSFRFFGVFSASKRWIELKLSQPTYLERTDVSIYEF